MSLKADRQWIVRSQLYLPSSHGSPRIELVFSCAEVYVYKSFTNNFQIIIVRHRKSKSEEFFSLYRRLQKGNSINRCKTQARYYRFSLRLKAYRMLTWCDIKLTYSSRWLASCLMTKPSWTLLYQWLYVFFSFFFRSPLEEFALA